MRSNHFHRILIAGVLLAVFMTSTFGGCTHGQNSELHTDTTVSSLQTEISTQSIPPETTAVSTLPMDLPETEPLDTVFVRVRDYIPDIVVELKYATEDNFTGQVIYDFSDAWLRYGTVKKLMVVQETLKVQGLRLKIWDGFRPVSAQFCLWDVYPDPDYVANPNSGFSSHSRGNTVDITLVDENGNELPMPTGFDDFSDLADRNYFDCGPEAAQNALLLEQIMVENGFIPYFGEWWHYADTVSYDVELEFCPAEG